MLDAAGLTSEERKTAVALFDRKIADVYAQNIFQNGSRSTDAGRALGRLKSVGICAKLAAAWRGDKCGGLPGSTSAVCNGRQWMFVSGLYFASSRDASASG
ncbi:MAG: hypothetical protein ACYCUV_05100 [Phycisphaerae bacterium]